MTVYATNTVSDSRVCPTCEGTGINPVATYLLCPKCNGEKWVPLPKREPKPWGSV